MIRKRKSNEEDRMLKVARVYPGRKVCARIAWLPISVVMKMSVEEMKYYRFHVTSRAVSSANKKCQ